MKGEGCKEEWLRRLRWQCRRGLLELDVWLDAFARKRLHALSAEDRVLLEQLLRESDADLLDWLNGRQNAPERFVRMIAGIRDAV